MENVEAHCFTSMLAFQLGGPKKFSDTDAAELLKIRKALGMVDQANLTECSLCSGQDEFRPGSISAAKAPAAKSAAGYDCDAEKLVARITQMIISELKK